MDLALKLVDIAKNAGADAVKFQTFKVKDVVTEQGEMASYQVKNIGKQMNQREMLKNLELPEEFYPEIMERTVDMLIENPGVSRIVFVQQKNYNYDF